MAAGAIKYSMQLDTGGFIGPMRSAQGAIAGILKTGSQIGNIATGFLSIGGIIKSALAPLTTPITLAADMEDLETSFAVMLKSGEAATRMIADLKKEASSTPLELGKDLAPATKSLLAFGVAQERIIPTLRNVGDVALGIGAPLTEIAEIYGKARVQGTLFAEDINQLTGRGIPVIQEFAKILGVSEGEVKKLGSEGKISFDMLEQAFTSLTGQGGQFYGMMEKRSKTFNGLLSTLRDTLAELWRTLGAPIADALKPALQDAAKIVANMTPMAQKFGEVFGAGVRGAVGMLRNGTLVEGIGKGLQIAFMEAGNTLYAVFTASTAAIGPLLMKSFGIAGSLLQNNIEGIASALSDGFSKAIGLLRNGAKVVGEIFSDPALLRGFGKALQGIFAGIKADMLDLLADFMGSIGRLGQADEFRKDADATRFEGASQSASAKIAFDESKLANIGKAISEAMATDSPIFNFDNVWTAGQSMFAQASEDFRDAWEEAKSIKPFGDPGQLKSELNGLFQQGLDAAGLVQPPSVDSSATGVSSTATRARLDPVAKARAEVMSEDTPASRMTQANRNYQPRRTGGILGMLTTPTENREANEAREDAAARARGETPKVRPDRIEASLGPSRPFKSLLALPQLQGAGYKQANDAMSPKTGPNDGGNSAAAEARKTNAKLDKLFAKPITVKMVGETSGGDGLF